MTSYVLAVDNGTTSTRAIIFDDQARKVGSAQKETTQIFLQSGWVEHDPMEIWNNTQEVISGALVDAKLSPSEISAVGITNQRETTIAWDLTTGRSVYNAIVWQDTRTQQWVDELEQKADFRHITSLTGLPVTAYFSGSKIRWILDNVPEARELAHAGQLAFGTPDTWIAWNLTGGSAGGRHVTDVTNASRTLLMSLTELRWDESLLATFGIPESVLPAILPSSGEFGTCTTSLPGVPLTGILGDQQAATFGQGAFDAGEAKNTYGTGNFLMLNTGTQPVASSNGLISTVAYQLAGSPAHYALEGSVAVSGSLIQWLRDNLGIIQDAKEVESLAASVQDNGGAYFVPAFSGLFAPYWQPDARGALVGLTRFVNKGHIARASLEATAYQSREVLDAMNADTGTTLPYLKVDGGMVFNELLMQFQADMLGVDVIRPKITETTALGAAFAAGLAVGVWKDLDQVRLLWQEDKRWTPSMPTNESERLLRQWKKAVSKSMNWVDEDTPSLV
jgi:glycerol kinase